MSGKPKVIKKPLSIQRVVGEIITEEDFKPEKRFSSPVLEVIDVEVAVAEVTFEAVKNAVTVKGVFYQQIYYVDETGSLKMERVKEKMEKNVALPESKAGYKAVGQVRLLEYDGVLTGETHISVVIRTEMRVTVLETVETNIVVDIENVDDIKIRRKRFSMEELTEEGYYSVNKTIPINLPGHAGTVVRVVSEFRECAAQVVENGVKVRGKLARTFFYTSGQENKVETFFDETAIEEELRIKGLSRGAQVYAEAFVTDDNISVPGIMEQGQEQRVAVEFYLRVFDVKNYELAAHITGPGIKITRESCRVKQLLKEIILTGTSEWVSTLPGAVSTVLYVKAKPGKVESTISDERVLIEGDIEHKLFVMDINNYFRVHPLRAQFNLNGPVPGCKPEHSTEIMPASPDNITHTLREARTLEHSTGTGALVRVAKNEIIELITGLEVVEVPDGINTKLYIVQEGDTYEKISGRFDTPVPEIVSVNPEISESSFYHGQRIRIPVEA